MSNTARLHPPPQPYSDAELRRIELVSDGDYMLTDGETAIMVVRRLLATIAERDAIIAKQAVALMGRK